MTGSYRGPEYDYVAHAAPGCTRGGCQFSAAAELVSQSGTAISQLMRSAMSQALWCDATEHAFSARDPDRQRLSITTADPDTKEEKLETRDFCGECARAAGLLKVGKGRYDPLKTKILEQQAGIVPPDGGD